MVGILEAIRFSCGYTLTGLSVFQCLDSQRPPAIRVFRFLEVLRFRMVVLLEATGIRMVGLLEASRFSMVRFLKAPWYSYSWTLRGPLVFVWLDS